MSIFERDHAASCAHCQAVAKAQTLTDRQIEGLRQAERAYDEDFRRMLATIAIVILAVAACLLFALRCDAAPPKRHASIYIYSRGKPVEPVERSQKIARELLVPAAGGFAGYQQMVVIVDLFATDPRPDRILWPHAAGVDTVWYGEIPDPAPGERSFAVVGRMGREVPDSVRVENAEGSVSIAVRRKR